MQQNLIAIGQHPHCEPLLSSVYSQRHGRFHAANQRMLVLQPVFNMVRQTAASLEPKYFENRPLSGNAACCPQLTCAKFDLLPMHSKVNLQPKLNLSRRAESEYARANADAVDIVIGVSCPIDSSTRSQQEPVQRVPRQIEVGEIK